jgi:Ca2+/Na+ antiporter
MHMGHTVLHILLSILVTVAIVITVASVVIQRRALNKIAFGRSMFISFSAIFFGLFVGLLPTLPAAIVSILFLLLGFGFLVFMAIKSAQHLKAVKGTKAAKRQGGTSEGFQHYS